MKQLIFLIFGLLYSGLLNAQLRDDFSDGNFSEAPAWMGDTSRFSVKSGELRLSDEAPGSANEAALSVFAPTSTEENTSWECFVRLDFAPSASNFTRLYLQAATPALRQPQTGYFLQVGGISGDGDALQLYRQDGEQSTMLLEGRAGAVGSDPVLVRVRIVRNSEGRWTLYADYQGGRDFELEGSVLDDRYPQGSYFGVYCRYTSTRAQAMAFDDILIDPLFEDRSSPLLTGAIAGSADTIRLTFNEALDPVSAGEVSNYDIDQGIGAPRRARLQPDDPAEVILELNQPLRNLNEYRVTAANIRDRAGNAAPAQSLTFTFFDLQPAASGDLLITEIMPDPSPPVSLPEFEYLELFNRSDKVLELGELFLSTGGSPRPLSSHQLLPGQYVLLCDEEAAPLFAEYGTVVPVEGFPSLTNGGDEIQLLGPASEPLLIQRYEDSWYRDPEKSNGGYSLELIQREAPANCPGNWRAGRDSRGGTPAQVNSVDGQVLEQQGPVLQRVVAESPRELLLFFDEALSENAADPTRYRLDPALPIDMVILQPPGNREVLLLLGEALTPGIVYTLRVEAGVRDCLGTPADEGQETLFGLPEAIAAEDLVVNEVLFRPEVGGADFVELYNRSDKILNLEGLQLINAQKTSGQISTDIKTPYLLFPDTYVVLTEDPADIRERYTVENPLALIENNLPTLNADFGNITLRSAGLTVDSFDYSETLHYPLLDDTRGVSLERIDPEAPTQSNGNWHSAASSAGFATPTAANSQRFSGNSRPDDLFELARPTFSPDGDGFEDVLLIRYRTERPGYVLNLRVFDAQGRPVRMLADNLLLAAEGQLKWDGANDEGAKARLGIYVLWFELFTADGRIIRERETCVLAGRLSD